ncbi:MAG: glycoside hydrolase family 88 protein [Gammaproteobacteria bacterium]|jgi:unsaturated chondroitin disaccharide hydrolase|nr:glycoside hydrolase family 88 protein [Gammaproteobacteria bacterium]|tara:strand:+ start:3853 stop:4998 length:1146 start_codon:yes stop_codon:yes gene_type:complete
MQVQSRIAQLRPKLSSAFEFSQKQVRNLVETYPDFFPMYTEGGRWRHEGEAWTNWCEGFLGGMMWVFHARTSDLWWREKAEHYSRLIEERKTDRNVHDLGFLFWSTWKRWYDLTGEDDIYQAVITAGKTMGLRFMEKGQYLRSFVAPESLFIDIMMNVGIVFYAAQQTSDATLLDKAHQHCLTTRRYLVRGDGSTAHEGIFDVETGGFLRQSTHQGWRGDSAWARGLAWALYGFGTAYGMTKDPRYLSTARLCAEFYLEYTPFEADTLGGPGIPPNDYDDPRQPVSYESSAAAIASSGLLNLSQLVQDQVYADRYLQAALTILDTLTSPEYLAIDTPGWEGILKHGIYHQTKGLGVDESVMWGEHFFVEAVDKVLSLGDER